MSEDKKDIKNLAAYCNKVRSNMKKNEYRSNDNEAKYATPTGIWFDGYKTPVADVSDIEALIAAKSPEDWLQFIENVALHRALSSLKPKDLAFVHEMALYGYSQAQMSERLGISQQAVSRRWQRIQRKIKKFF